MVQEKGLGESEARFCFQQLIMALDYCHCLGISVRDIKVLVSSCPDRFTTRHSSIATAVAHEESLLWELCGFHGSCSRTDTGHVKLGVGCAHLSADVLCLLGQAMMRAMPQ